MALVIKVKVVPSAGRSEFVIDKNGMLKCFLKSPPQKGLANYELIGLLASSIGIARAYVHLVGGATSRTKTLKLELDWSYERLLESLGLAYQRPL